ncbi:hypothetical protein Fmac_025677 [Flemingia macrophylla]|uniref:DUF7906 domain-containing protein n=1 Tax=Flemingia macrophylla TaxID=520843 RepID=A0ABD1LSW8_9FABA
MAQKSFNSHDTSSDEEDVFSFVLRERAFKMKYTQLHMKRQTSLNKTRTKGENNQLYPPLPLPQLCRASPCIPPSRNPSRKPQACPHLPSSPSPSPSASSSTWWATSPLTPLPTSRPSWAKHPHHRFHPITPFEQSDTLSLSHTLHLQTTLSRPSLASQLSQTLSNLIHSNPSPLRSPLLSIPHSGSITLSRHLTLPEPPSPHTLRQSHLRQTLSRLHSRLLRCRQSVPLPLPQPRQFPSNR